MYVLGLTGGIASGKSTVAGILAELGARVWDADQASRRVVEPGQPGLQALRREFSPEFFDPQGSLKRAALGSYVFGHPERVARLNAALHPYILLDMEETLAHWREQGVKVAVVEAPLLFETGIDRLTDAVWTLASDVSLRCRRIMERDGLSPEQAKARVDAQMTDAQRQLRAHRVINTSGSVEATRRQVQKLFRELLEENHCADSPDGC